MDNNKVHNENGEVTPRKNFQEQLYALPPALQKRISKNLSIAMAFALFTIILMICGKSLCFFPGFIIALYIAYLGLDILWQYRDGKIICQKMICVKASRFLKTQRLILILRELEDIKDPNKAIHEFYIEASKRDIVLLTPNTILNVYYNPKNQMELTAWEIIDFADPK